MSQPLRRMRDFPEIMDAERSAILDPAISLRGADFHPAIMKAAKAVCGVTAWDVHAWCNEASQAISDREQLGEILSVEVWEEAYRKDDERSNLFCAPDETMPTSDADVLSFYRSIGWCPLNDRGQVLLVAANLVLPFKAAAISAGEARFPEPGTELARAWGEKIVATPRRRLGETPVISEEERRRRNAEARCSTTWRPSATSRKAK